jgi:hypothetical protein
VGSGRLAHRRPESELKSLAVDAGEPTATALLFAQVVPSRGLVALLALRVLSVGLL